MRRAGPEDLVVQVDRVEADQAVVVEAVDSRRAEEASAADPAVVALEEAAVAAVSEGAVLVLVDVVLVDAAGAGRIKPSSEIARGAATIKSACSSSIRSRTPRSMLRRFR